MISSMDLQSLSLQLVTTFAHFLWQGVLIGAVLTVLLYLCSSRSAKTRYVIASVAFGLLPLCVGATFAIVHYASDPLFIAQVSTEKAASMPARSSVSPELPQTEIVDTAIRSGSAALPPQLQVAEAAAPTGATNSSRSSWLSAASPYVIVVYLVGVVVSLLRLGSSIWTSGKLRRAVKKIEDASITRIVAAQASRMGLKRIPLFALCERISVPVVVGILKPTILLPPAILCGLDPQQLAAILSHEMAHIRRYDLLVNLLQRLVESLLFFHPVTWWISRRMSAERENCCDDLAVAGSGRLEFASALLHMAELCAKNRGLAIGSQLEAMAADGGKQSQLTRRVYRLLGEVDTPRFFLSRMSVVMAIIVALTLTVSVLVFAQTETNQSDGSSESGGEGLASSDDRTTDKPNADVAYYDLPIAWGEPKNGFRIGSMFIEGPDNALMRFRHGELVQAQLFVQNVDSTAVQCQVLLPHPMDGWGLNIEKSDGESVLPNQVFISSFSPLRLFEAVLAPKEIQPITGKLPKFREGNEDEGYVPELKHVEFQIEAKTPEQGQHTPPFAYGLQKGTYRASSFVTLRLPGTPGGDIPLSTGAVSFQVSDTLDGEVNVQGIQWGKPVSGLRMGARFSGVTDASPTRFNNSDAAKVELFVQNTTEEPIAGQFMLNHPYDGWWLSMENDRSAGFEPARIVVGYFVPPRFLTTRLAAGEVLRLTGRKGDDGIESVAVFRIEPKAGEPKVMPPFVYGLPTGRYQASYGTSFVPHGKMMNESFFLKAAPLRYLIGEADDVWPVKELKSGKTNETPETSGFVAAPPQLPQSLELPDGQTDTDNNLASEKEKPAKVEGINEAQSASHYEGTVLGPDGKPMQGAEVFVISSWNEASKLGPVRDVTDADGKFSFDAVDMTWQMLGKTMRRGGLIVAKKQGFVPEWMESWGHSRGPFSTGLWGQTKEQTLELQLTHDDVPIRGQLLDADGNPLAGARMRLTRIMIPRNRDLTAFLEHWTKANVTATFMTGISYKREINQHFELMNLNSEWVSDANGRFELSGIGRDRIVELEIAAPEIITTSIQVMSRDTEEVGILLDGLGDQGKPTQTIYGANFSIKLTPGLTVTGVVRDRDTKQPVAGMWIMNRGYNPLTAPEQKKDAVVTDSNGRFTLRGLDPKLLDYEKESTRWVSAIPQPGVQYLKAGKVFEKNKDTVIETARGIGYRLKVVDEDGKLGNATIEYRRIHPNSVGSEMIKSVGGGADGDLNHAARRDDGTYEGFVLPGPGAVIVSVSGNEYRPAHVEPKSFFEPGKTWHEDSNTYTYGTHNILATGGGWLDQREYEAIVLVNPSADSEPLTLTTTLNRDRPRVIALVDNDGNPVFGTIARMHERRGTSHVNATISGSSFPLEGLNVDKDQWITFLHTEKKLATVVAIRGDDDAGVTVRLQPWGAVKGRFVDANGTPVSITGEAEFSTIVKNVAHGATEYFAHTVNEDGTFQIEGFATGQSYSTDGTYRKRKNYIPGGLFKNLDLGPGEIRDLGDIVVHIP